MSEKTLKGTLTSIANSIRSVDKTTEPIHVDDMPSRITALLYADSVYHSVPPYNGKYAIEAANAAESYARAIYADLHTFAYSNKTPLDGVIKNEYDECLIDNATFIGLVLRGYSYTISPYESGDSTCELPSKTTDGDYIWVSGPEWADHDLDAQDEKFFDNGIVRTASDLAVYMWMNGRCFTDTTQLKIGDLVFFSTTDNNNNNFKNVYNAGIVYKFNNTQLAILSISEDGEGSGDVSINYSKLNDHPYENVAFFARPDYGKKYQFPEFDKETNRIAYPWIGLNEVEDSGVEVVADGYSGNIEISYDETPTDFILRLYDEFACTIELEPGTYELSGCPDVDAGVLCLENINDNSEIYEDNGDGGISFTIDEYKEYTAYIRISATDGLTGNGSGMIWTPKLCRVE